jgi:hypothetical protein
MPVAAKETQAKADPDEPAASGAHSGQQFMMDYMISLAGTLIAALHAGFQTLIGICRRAVQEL